MPSTSQKAFLWDQLERAIEDQAVNIQKIQNETPMGTLEGRKLESFLDSYESPVVHDFDPSGDEHPPACMCPCCDLTEGKE